MTAILIMTIFGAGRHCNGHTPSQLPRLIFDTIPHKLPGNAISAQKMPQSNWEVSINAMKAVKFSVTATTSL